MESGYKILWTDFALEELANTIEYLKDNFSEKEINKLAREIERITELISKNPEIFPNSEKMNIRKVVILRFNTLYYRINNQNIEIISFFSNRQSPANRKI